MSDDFVVPTYEDGGSDSGSEQEISDIEEGSFNGISATPLPTADVEYDSEGSPMDATASLGYLSGAEGANLYIAREGSNYFTDAAGKAVVICLHSYEQLAVSGIFKLQVLKGGITYNSVHYNCGLQLHDFWHPLSESIPPIAASFASDWEEQSYGLPSWLPADIREEYECVLRLTEGSNAGDVGRLMAELGQLWTRQPCRTFSILRPEEYPRPLLLSKDWANLQAELMLHHMNSEHDMRVMCIGGKNSGKSTLLRLLLQKFLHGNRPTSKKGTGVLHEVDIVNYLDMDPGQPEYSAPDSISWSRLTSDTLSLGQHMAQGHREIVEMTYIGSSTPQTWPEMYLAAMERIIHKWETEGHMNTSVLNLPGWIKGFGITIINKALELFKPTHIIFLTHGGKLISRELVVPEMFETAQKGNYKPITYTLQAFTQHNIPGPPTQDPRYHVANIRNFRLLAHLHRLSENSYYPSPLLSSPPLQVSFGSQGVMAFRFLQDPSSGYHQDDIYATLQGCVVCLYHSKMPLDIEMRGSFPMLKTSANYTSMNFVTLALIHSIDVERKFMNIYIPGHVSGHVHSLKNNFVLVRGATDLPLCELYPQKLLSSTHRNRKIPYVSFSKRKKYEYVWKIRKNVRRRGHYNK
ncbi:AaceriAFR189Cp [[Ashbya] aceris (nom. inval.)]|nr:AaceriAFR189Cp [[Ashbya] aceris (nom. inval.)]